MGKFIKASITLLIMCVFTSCSLFIKRSEFVYWQDAPKAAMAGKQKPVQDTLAPEQLDSLIGSSIRIQAYDVLDIRLVQTTEGFTRMLESSGQGQNTNINTAITQANIAANGYYSGFMVDQEGNINYPFIGKVYVKGKTIAETKEILKSKLSGYLIEPFVDVKFLSFRINVLGAVNHPGIVIVSSEKATLLDAIAQAGDISEFGLPSKIKVLRGDTRNPTVLYVDLTKMNSFQAPGYYLMPNDIVYVEPSKRKFARSNLTTLTAFVSFVNLIAVLGTLYFRAR